MVAKQPAKRQLCMIICFDVGSYAWKHESYKLSTRNSQRLNGTAKMQIEWGRQHNLCKKCFLLHKLGRTLMWLWKGRDWTVNEGNSMQRSNHLGKPLLGWLAMEHILAMVREMFKHSSYSTSRIRMTSRQRSKTHRCYSFSNPEKADNHFTL